MLETSQERRIEDIVFCRRRWWHVRSRKIKVILSLCFHSIKPPESQKRERELGV